MHTALLLASMMARSLYDNLPIRGWDFSEPWLTCEYETLSEQPQRQCRTYYYSYVLVRHLHESQTSTTFFLPLSHAIMWAVVLLGDLDICYPRRCSIGRTPIRSIYHGPMSRCVNPASLTSVHSTIPGHSSLRDGLHSIKGI